jgi:hypothetical protein
VKLKGPITVKEAGAIGISLVLLIASLFVILSSNYEIAVRNWAFGTIGTVLGFWLRR